VKKMEYVYTAMLLHSAENEINEKNVGAVLKAAGVKADDARVKALVASLSDVDIGEAMSAAIAAPVAAAPAAGAAATAEAAPAEEAAAEEEEDDASFDGLGSLFG
jgi:large subunit ribosomal protein L12